jgi:HD superfamily phosphohydrolase
MDYVPRDSYVCGVAVGPVDVQRILHYTFVSGDGIALHDHGAEALFMFLNARLYLYHQVYYHRTVRRIDLQLREIFAPTLDRLLGGNPLERMDDYLQLTEWSLMSEVDRWRRERDAELRRLGESWTDVLARRLKWQLVFTSYLESREVTPAVMFMTRAEFAERIRERLPAHLRETEFEVDVAVQQSGARNPLAETDDILLYDPLQDAFRRSSVLDLFRRLPVRMALFRIFARDRDHAADLRRAAESVLAERETQPAASA